MEGQVIAQNLGHEISCSPVVGLTREEAQKLLEYVTGLEKALAGVLRFQYEERTRKRKHRTRRKKTAA